MEKGCDGRARVDVTRRPNIACGHYLRLSFYTSALQADSQDRIKTYYAKVRDAESGVSTREY